MLRLKVLPLQCCASFGDAAEISVLGCDFTRRAEVKKLRIPFIAIVHLA